jgi:hypothetical protein
MYHSKRIPAAVSYCLYKKTNDPVALDQAIFYERDAVEAWKQIIKAARRVYTDNFLMGLKGGGNDGIKTDLTGHWKTELAILEKSLSNLENERNNPGVFNGEKAPLYQAVNRGDYGNLFKVNHHPVTSADAGKPIKIQVEIKEPSKIKWVRLRYRDINQREDYRTLAMTETSRKGVFEVLVSADQINPKWDFMYFIEVMNKKGQGAIFPDLNIETPYVVCKLQRD